MNDLISVVVPVYKVEKYLRRCIDSIIFQSYKNIEIILVNDGSPDNCPRICDEYAMKFSNVYVIHQKNRGLSAARNTGIEASKGNYITFIDSDDFINNNMLMELKKNMDDNKSLLSMCSFLEVHSTEVSNHKSLKKKDIKILNDNQAMNMLLNNQKTCVAWGKLYDIKLFDEVRFPVGKICEDMFVTPVIFRKAKKVIVDAREMYFYNQKGSSITRSNFNYKKLDMVEATYLWKQITDKYYPELSEKAHMHYLTTVINTCIYLAKQNDTYGKSTFKKYVSTIMKNYEYFMKSNYVRKNDKFKAFLMKHKLFKLLVQIKY